MPGPLAAAWCGFTNYWGHVLGHQWPEQKKQAMNGHLAIGSAQGVYAPVRSTPAFQGRDCPAAAIL